MGRPLVDWINIMKIAILPKAIYRFIVVFIKILMLFLEEIKVKAHEPKKSLEKRIMLEQPSCLTSSYSREPQQ